MSAPLPQQAAIAVVSMAVTAKGKLLDTRWPLQSIDVWHQRGTPSTARLALRDGDMNGNFAITDSDALAAGSVVEIALGYGGANTTVFSGTVTRQSLAIVAENMVLTIDLRGSVPDAANGAAAPRLSVVLGDAIQDASLAVEPGAGVRGTLVYQGSALAGVGDVITIGGLGKRFSGDIRLTGVHHAAADGNWRTTATVGR